MGRCSQAWGSGSVHACKCLGLARMPRQLPVRGHAVVGCLILGQPGSSTPRLPYGLRWRICHSHPQATMAQVVLQRKLCAV